MHEADEDEEKAGRSLKSIQIQWIIYRHYAVRGELGQTFYFTDLEKIKLHKNANDQAMVASWG